MFKAIAKWWTKIMAPSHDEYECCTGVRFKSQMTDQQRKIYNAIADQRPEWVTETNDAKLAASYQKYEKDMAKHNRGIPKAASPDRKKSAEDSPSSNSYPSYVPYIYSAPDPSPAPHPSYSGGGGDYGGAGSSGSWDSGSSSSSDSSSSSSSTD